MYRSRPNYHEWLINQPTLLAFRYWKNVRWLQISTLKYPSKEQWACEMSSRQVRVDLTNGMYYLSIIFTLCHIYTTYTSSISYLIELYPITFSRECLMSSMLYVSIIFIIFIERFLSFATRKTANSITPIIFIRSTQTEKGFMLPRIT